MAKHHDTGYKELFSHPEFVQQLIEGFAPAEIAALMDFSTLKNHSGNYITPLFEERFEDVVWSVQVHWQGVTERVFVYLLIEFQSTVDPTMPLRMLHYVACFYQHLLKTKVTTPAKGLPPILPIVLYNGLERWQAAEDIDALVRPTPPAFLHAYQPHLRYHLIDEGPLHARAAGPHRQSVERCVRGRDRLPRARPAASGRRSTGTPDPGRPQQGAPGSAHHPLAQAPPPALGRADRPHTDPLTRRGQDHVSRELTALGRTRAAGGAFGGAAGR
ncbi:Rpn family recombination-promoting nuclease/putative transposase [Halochromatium salexigens]|uniref:Rpn family recombination-promoting nuclease/putative transposase n=1 Tax=Halochromatium salexigens TaxID=49447 RepID=UPI001F5C3F28|nr:Rpn family recombination-promoting nuclease/putative transposase [Halochromatium salexigens]